MNKPHYDLCDQMLTDKERETVKRLINFGEYGIVVLKNPKPKPKERGDDWNAREEQAGYGSSPLSSILFGNSYMEPSPTYADLCLKCTLKIIAEILDRLFKTHLKLAEE